MLVSMFANCVFAADIEKNADFVIFSLIDENILSAELKFNAAKSGNADVIAAQYDSDEQLKSLEILDTIQVTENEIKEYTTKNITVADDNTLKIFIWNSASVITPVMKTPAVVKIKPEASSVKFVKADEAKNAYDFNSTVNVGELFEVVSGSILDKANIKITVAPANDESTVTGTYTADTADWTKGTIAFDGFGDATVTITDGYYCADTAINVAINPPPSVDKFVTLENLDFIHEIEGGTITKTLGDIFKAVDGVEIDSANVDVTISGDSICEYTKDESDWKNSSLEFTGTGSVTITVTDENFCNEATAKITVSDKEYTDKFVASENLDFIYEGEIITKTLGDIFTSVEGAEINSAKVDVTVDGAICEYTKDEADWTKSVVKFNGAGTVTITITDKNYCNEAVATVVVTEKQPEDKFTVNENLDFTFETEGEAVTKTLGDIFKALDNVEINSSTVTVTVSGDDICEYTNDSADWTKSTLKFSKAGVVTVTITDNNYCNEVSATINASEIYTDKFVAKFDNDSETAGVQTDFLYRVGNGNTVALSSLFEAKENAVIGDVTVTVSALNGASASGAHTKNTTDWTKGTIQFTGTGPVKVVIDDNKYANELELILEVVDAKNATTATSATANNVVLLNDVSGTFVVSGGYTFYGNGFEVTLPTDHRREIGTGFSGYIHIDNGHLDNVKIIGPVYPEQYMYREQAKTGEYSTGSAPQEIIQYFVNSVLINSGNSTIKNSYISGSRAAVYVKSGDNVVIENSTISGGSYANIEIAGSKSTTLRNVTTVQNPVMDSYGLGKEMRGLGVVVSNNLVDVYLEGELKQYNWLSQADANTYVPSTHKSTFNSFYTNSTYTKFWHYRPDDSSTKYINYGLIFACEWDTSKIHDLRFNSSVITYATQSVTISAGILGSVKGGIYTNTNCGTLTDELYIAPEYKATVQGSVAPKVTFDYTGKNNRPAQADSNEYCYYDSTSKKYMISFDEGAYGTWDGNIITITKGLNTLDSTISVSGGAVLNSDNNVTFTTAGDYKVTYSYTDGENYRQSSSGAIEQYSVSYTKEIDITVYTVAPEAVPTTFDFLGKGYRTESAGGLVYAMPNVTETVDSNTAGIRKVTKDGVDIYYPVVSMHKSGNSSWYNYFSVFEAVTITDCDETTVYNTSTTAMPSNLEVIGGFILNANGAVSAAETANGIKIFNYSTGKDILCKTYSSYGLCYYPDSNFTSTGTTDRAEQTIVAKYRYTDSNGSAYYYYVGYWCQQHTQADSCVTPDTLVTLADGSQKRIDAVTSTDMLKVWNFEKGEYAIVPSAVIRNHGYGNNKVITLEFDDGTVTKVVNEHGYFDADINKFVLFNDENATDYIGHSFVKEDGSGYKTAKLVNVSVKDEYIEAYSILSVYHYNFITDGMFSLTSSVAGLDYFMPFEVGENMKYDEAKMKADIEKYGLYTYDELSEYLTYEEYIALNAEIIKVSVGKGIISFEEFKKIIDIEVKGN